jgi:hypothetical protein
VKTEQLESNLERNAPSSIFLNDRDQTRLSTDLVVPLALVRDLVHDLHHRELSQGCQRKTTTISAFKPGRPAILILQLELTK